VAEHDVAPGELHVSVEAPLVATVVGLAVNVAVGAVGAGALTVTVALAALLVPPDPVQVRRKSVVAVSAPVLWVPLVARVPVQPPVAVQEVALVELQTNIDESPLLIVGVDALSEAVAAGTVAAAGLPPPPPPPHALSANAAVITTTRTNTVMSSLCPKCYVIRLPCARDYCGHGILLTRDGRHTGWAGSLSGALGFCRLVGRGSG
jgi:hypothetical protein